MSALNFFKSIYFNTDFYLEQKSAQLNANNPDDTWNSNKVLRAIENAGMTPWEHYVRYGSHEINSDNDLGIDPTPLFSTHSYYQSIASHSGISVQEAMYSIRTDPITDYATRGYSLGLTVQPAEENASFSHESKLDAYKALYFNEDEYLENKTAALNASHYQGKTWDIASTRKEISDTGMSLWQHFCKHGAFEKDANGDIGIDPSHYFDVSKYYSDKSHITNMDALSIAKAFKELGIDPITHYTNYGYKEGITPTQIDLSSINGNDINNTIPLSGDLLIDSVLYTNLDYWINMNEIGSHQNNTLFYHFVSNNDFTTLGITDGTECTDLQKQGFYQGLEVVADVTGIEFEENNNASESNILFYTATEQNWGDELAAGWATTNSENQSLVVLNNQFDVPHNENPTIGGYGFHVVIHELAHALGLKHPFVEESYDENISALPAVLDTNVWSEMSGTYPTGEDLNWYSDGIVYYSPVDILALKYIYGTDGLNGAEGVSYDMA